MTQERGARVSDYAAPLFLAWQLTNRCSARCLHCCEESGPDKAWKGELSRQERLSLARQIAECGIPYVAFGGGEPTTASGAWEVFEELGRGGVRIKIETDGSSMDKAAAWRLKKLGVSSIQISVDGASPEIHEALRPGGSWKKAVEALEILALEGLSPELVFVPTKLNIHDAVKTLDLAVSLGARRFVTGPLMRLGRAVKAWERLAVSDGEWDQTVRLLNARAENFGGRIETAIYPWDIREEAAVRLQSPQAMMLVVPDGKVKLLNALPFFAADLRKDSLKEAWAKTVKAWASPRVRDFISALQKDPGLFRHANECWAVNGKLQGL